MKCHTVNIKSDQGQLVEVLTGLTKESAEANALDILTNPESIARLMKAYPGQTFVEAVAATKGFEKRARKAKAGSKLMEQLGTAEVKVAALADEIRKNPTPTDEAITAATLARIPTEAEKSSVLASQTERTFLRPSLEEEKTGLEKALADNEGIRRLLTPAVDIDSVADGSVSISELVDMRHWFRSAQEKTGQPFYSVWKRLRTGSATAKYIHKHYMDRIRNNPRLRSILNNNKMLARVAQEINSRNPHLEVDPPQNLTLEEKELADIISSIYKEYETKIRFMRFTEAMDAHDNVVPAVQKDIINSVEAELYYAAQLYLAHDYPALLDYLAGKTWGVIGSGFDPYTVSKPDLKPAKISLGTVRGGSHLLGKQSVEFHESDKNVVQRLNTYVMGIETRWQVWRDAQELAKLWKNSGTKFKDMKHTENLLLQYMSELQGIPIRGSWGDRLLRRQYRLVASAVFVNPYLAYRNSMQHLTFHPDRTEVIGTMVKKMLNPTVPMLDPLVEIYYEWHVSQMRGIRSDFLMQGERSLIPLLDPLVRIADRISLYSLSDNIPRKISFAASYNKANRAARRFARDGNIKGFIRRSGAQHLTKTEQDYALQLTVQPNVDLGLEGMRNVEGTTAASLYIADEIAAMTHMKYERSERAPIEHGGSGRSVWNLFTFTRSYAQRVGLQLKKMGGKKIPINERLDAFKNIMFLFISGIIASEWLILTTGRRRRAYNPIDVMQWQVGGLALGVATEMTQAVGDLLAAIGGDEEGKERAMNRLTAQIPRLVSTQIPFYTMILDAVEVVIDEENIDVNFLKQMRAKIDENYTPEEQEKLNRSLFEKFQHVIFGAPAPEPDDYEEVVQLLVDAEEQLGKRDEKGYLHTLRDYATVVNKVESRFPSEMIREDLGFPELAAFYQDTEDIWRPYYLLEDDPYGRVPINTLKLNYRRENPQIEALLFFWGKVKRLHSTEAAAIVVALVGEFDLSKEALPMSEETPVEWEAKRRMLRIAGLAK